MAPYWCNDMRNYINQELVQDREIGDREVQELQCLHYIAESIIMRAISEFGKDQTREQVEASFEAMKFVEYEMQKRWGFPLMERYHTHKKRLGRALGL